MLFSGSWMEGMFGRSCERKVITRKERKKPHNHPRRIYRFRTHHMLFTYITNLLKLSDSFLK
jgi:hypothetical protein